jgi:hypothetical protein
MGSTLTCVGNYETHNSSKNKNNANGAQINVVDTTCYSLKMLCRAERGLTASIGDSQMTAPVTVPSVRRPRILLTGVGALSRSLHSLQHLLGLPEQVPVHPLVEVSLRNGQLQGTGLWVWHLSKESVVGPMARIE